MLNKRISQHSQMNSKFFRDSNDQNFMFMQSFILENSSSRLGADLNIHETSLNDSRIAPRI